MSDRIGILGRSVDLYVRLVDSIGNPTNADTTPTVTIYDSAGTIRQSSTNVGVSLVEDPGLYKLSYSIPITAIDGYWSDIWSADIGGETIETGFTFLVLSSGEMSEGEEQVYTPGDDHEWDFTQDEVVGINRLLKIIKARLKNNGVRHVSDGAGGYVEVPCAVFTDDELTAFLVNGLSSFNQYPHFTNYAFSDPQTYTLFADIIVQGGVLLALAAQALIERGREFTINDSGVTYQPPQIAEILNSQYSTQLADYKEKLKIIKSSHKMAPRGLGIFRTTSINPNFLRLRHLRERRVI